MPENPVDNPDVKTISVNAAPEAEQSDSAETETIVNAEEEVETQDPADQTLASEETESQDNTDNSQQEEDLQEETVSDSSADDSDSSEKQNKSIDWKDAYTRLAADFDNYRKRTSKEQDDIRKRERERVVKIWLEVYDNAERALESMPEKSGPWFEGFSSLIQQMDKTLAQLNIKVVNDIGEKFDPKRHEAISIVQDPSKENNTIVYVMQKGFIYENGDVARVAKVVVVKNPS